MIGPFLRRLRLDAARAARADRPTTATGVAAALDIDRSFLSQVENGHQRPSREMLKRLLDYYEASEPERTEAAVLFATPNAAQSVA
jgi:transcriptional regulator with XRE-family HTH domain